MDLTFQLTEDDVALFARASGDFSPLHVDAVYARRTPYGRPVAHGVLGALRALGAVPAAGKRVRELSAEFGNPMFAGESYDVQVRNPADGKPRVAVTGRSGTQLTLKLQFDDGARSLEFGAPADMPTVAAEPAPVPLETSLSWAPDRIALTSLCDGLGVDLAAAAALSACSYIIGMVVPGRAALFTRLTLRLEPVPAVALPLTLKVSAGPVDERFGMSTIEVTLEAADRQPFGEATLTAMWRRAPSQIDAAKLSVAEGSLAGRHALVIGGSRGLGAALTIGLQRAGAACHVTYSSVPPNTNAAATRSDAASVDDNLVLAEQLAQTGFNPDILVLNASPSFWKLAVTRAATGTVLREIDALLAPLVVPLTAHLDAVSADGAVVLVSSSYVENPKADWPHYVAAKSAAEAFVRSVAAAHPKRQFIIARPPRLKTDLTNTTTGWEGALDPEQIASDIVRALATSTPGVRVLSWESPP